MCTNAGGTPVLIAGRTLARNPWCAVVFHRIASPLCLGGVRIALGATRQRVEAAILKDGLRLVLIGIAAGLVLARIFGRVLGGMLFQVRADDLAVFALASIGVAVISVVGIYVPARKGSRLNPVAALRVE